MYDFGGADNEAFCDIKIIAAVKRAAKTSNAEIKYIKAGITNTTNDVADSGYAFEYYKK
jgi:hypothetical protein